MEDGSKGKLKDPRVSMVKSSSTASLKRARRTNNGTHVASCLVDGCNSDLSKCRDYHRRHKVCELHSKTSKVTIKGQEQRFCQQCSRFHSLVEFDQGKRSCRRRLDGHNRRRRKPQLEPMPTNSERFPSSYQGTRFLPLGSPQMYPTSAAMNSSWGGGAVKAENDGVLINSHSQLSETSNSLYGSLLCHSYIGKQVAFVQGIGTSMLSEASLSCQPPLVDTNFALGNCGNSQKMFPNDTESDHALSLLSLTPATQEIGLSHTEQSSSVCPPRPFIHRLHYNDLGMEAEDGPVISSLVTDHASSNANLHCQGMFQIIPDGSTAGGPH